MSIHNWRKKCRIVKTEVPNHGNVYTIYQRHFLFLWWWVPAWCNCFDSTATSTFPTFEEAYQNLWKFNGTKIKDQ